ncbi:protein RNA-directed DNA methylation 3 isoform X2 [Medicago truncatula]|uniref:protein RNA-directed DNA methylation 3 isoform X2 n=1 Tax=Medicago truncatula TaxID=3880 RepID=UPI000D2F1E84|nr:protein RNA-directed DNA methylation 3 isoform X2 [Medicago truncatula]XP_024639185.1 protein RNA-directed DNA methylation 3 isoform X2 [Medicago truncatula]
MLLKDGFLYKKVSLDSLNFWDVVPTEEELLKFGPSKNSESNDMEWLSNIYGDSKKKRVIIAEKGGDGKGEGSLASGAGNDFELYALVRFRKKEENCVIISTDKDGTYKILKESLNGPVAVTVQQNKIKSVMCAQFWHHLEKSGSSSTTYFAKGVMSNVENLLKSLLGFMLLSV